MLFFNRHMTTPPISLSPPKSTPLPSTSKKTSKATRLRSLATRPIRMERPVIHVDPTTGKADGAHKNELRTYLGIAAQDKVDAIFVNWK